MSTTEIRNGLKEQWIAFRAEHPQVRIRDAARKMQTTEAGILASFAGSSTMQLNNEFPSLIRRLHELGYIMSLTRNESCVHERKGVFEEVAIHGRHVGVVTGSDIDLRMFFQHWAYAWAVFMDADAGFKDSIQVFDHQGTAVLKIFLQKDSDHAAFESIVRDFSAASQPTRLVLSPAPPPPVYRDDRVDVTAFRTDWSELKDTHDFYPMLKKHNVSRLHALRIAGDYAKKVDNDTVLRLLEKASAGDWEIMVFVGNHGNIQIHTGAVKNIVPIPGWINVMDPAFNLHLRLPDIQETWIVKKPTTDGMVHSLELFDAAGELIVQFFGKRKPGIPENTVWREWIRGL
ncbi:MAG TPA: ChuX/HutX family heme-like substrate-binding protein [Puia sp.]|nr:ChuX/HutX family heme-like substrate-binding protein [Puia sp.]